MTFERFKTWAQAYLSAGEIDPQTVDIEAEYDSTLTFGENKDSFKAKFPISNVEQLAKLEASALKSDIAERELDRQYATYVQEEEKRVIESIKADEGTHYLSRFHETLKALIRNVAEGYNHSLFVVSEEAGIGKSTVLFSTLNSLNMKANVDYAYLNGYSTPLSLYEALYEHRDKKLIVMDDLDVAYSDKKVIGILKAATWSPTGQRKVSYHSTSKALKAPEEFILNARIILISNILPESPSIKPLINRALFYKIEFSHKVRLALLADFSKLPYKTLTFEQRDAVLMFLTEKDSHLIKDLSFRTILKIYELVLQYPQNWQTFAKNILNIDEDMKAFSIAQAEQTTASQIEKFEGLTGLGRRTFFRLKRKYFQMLSGSDEL